MFLRRAAASLALVPMLLFAAPVHAQATGCQFILGFATLHSLDPNDIGDCADNQAYAANGDAQQHTTNGLMVWRKADNFTAFTDGTHTWVNGPNGLAERMNTQRFSWEANPDGLPVVPDQTPATPSNAASDTSDIANLTPDQKLYYAGNIASQIAGTLWTNDVESYNELSDVFASSLPIGASALDDANNLTQAQYIASSTQIDASHYRYDVAAAGQVWSGLRPASVTFHWFIVVNINTQKGHFVGYTID